MPWTLTKSSRLVRFDLSTSTVVASLTDKVVFASSCGVRFKVTVSAPIPLPDTDDDANILRVASDINAELERWIRANPSQWFWPHRRWGKDV